MGKAQEKREAALLEEQKKRYPGWAREAERRQSKEEGQ